MEILVTMPAGPVRNTFIPPELADRINSMGHVEWNMLGRQFGTSELKEKIRNKDVCITGWGCPRFDENILEEAGRLKLVAHTGGTVANIVSDCLYDKGIRVVSGNRFYAESVAEGVIAYILCSLRKLPFFANEMQNGRWRPADYKNEGLLDQTIGIVGFGTISKLLVNMLKPFRNRILVYSGHISDEECREYGVKRASMDELFSTCRIISVHAANRPDTYHMIGKRLLGMIQEGALLVNTARGGIIDEAALAEELKKGRFNAILDVFEEEPLPKESRLIGLENAILIPHMAGPTTDRRKYVTGGLIEDIESFFAGGELKCEIDRSYAKFMTV